MAKTMRSHFATRGPGSAMLAQTPQTKPIPGREREMVKNLSGGYAFKREDIDLFRRFLITGTLNGTYYAQGAKLTKDFVNIVNDLASVGKYDDIFAVMDDVNDNSLAASKDPTLYVLAYLTSSTFPVAERTKAWSRLKRYCRIGTHLLHFIDYMEGFHGWGYASRKYVGQWFTERSIDSLANQAIKYRQRDGWAMRDALMLAHPKPENGAQDLMFKFLTTKDPKDLEKRLGERVGELPPLVRAYLLAQEAKEPKVVVDLIFEHGLTMEMIPTEMLKHKAVWEALLVRKQGLTWLVRNAGNLTRRDIFNDPKMLDMYVQAVQTWAEEDNAKVHPINYFLAWKFYQAGGKGGKSRNSEFTPMRSVTDLLGRKFMDSLGSLERRPGKHVIVLDESQSMSHATSGKDIISCWDAALGIGICLQNRYEQASVWSFDTGLRKRSGLIGLDWKAQGGGTDMSKAVEAFVRECDGPNKPDSLIVLTDTESYAGNGHVAQAMTRLRRDQKRRIKLACLDLGQANGSPLDPKDTDSLLINGFDASAVTVLEGFLNS